MSSPYERRSLLCGALTLVAFTGTLNAQTAPVERPSYKLLRFQEDWSALADGPFEPTDWWDAIKYVPLTHDGDVWASFGGHARLRLESWSNFAFGAPADDNDTFLLSRLFLHGDVHFGANLRIFVEGKTAGSTERDLPGGRRTIDVDALDLEQAFADVRFDLGDRATLTLRPGRQALLFGKQRLVSPLPWGNTQRQWDGVSAILDTPTWTVQGFWTQFVRVQKYAFNEADAQTQFFGAYATTHLGDGGPGLDVYALGLDRDDAVTVNGTTGPEERYTLGARLFGALDSGLTYDVEGAYQFGEVGTADVNAFMVGAQLGYRFADATGKPGVSVGFDFGSGDDDAGGDVETFNQLFPLGHAYLGAMDFVGRQNVIDANLAFDITPARDWKISLAGHAFWRASSEDALYNAGGAVVRPGNAGASSEIGQEIDLTVKYAFNRHLDALFGYSHFFAGDFLNDSGAGDDMDFLYVQLQYTF